MHAKVSLRPNWFSLKLFIYLQKDTSLLIAVGNEDFIVGEHQWRGGENRFIYVRPPRESAMKFSGFWVK